MVRIFSFFKILFIYLREREREQGRGTGGEADSPLGRELDVEFSPRTLGS